MPNVEKCQEWIHESRKILGMAEAAKMDKRNNEIAALLKDKDIVGANAFTDFKDAYEDLATRASNIRQGASGKNAKADLEEIAGELRTLKKKVRLAAAAKDPTLNKKVQAELLSATKHEPFYRDKRERVTAAIKTIGSMSGTQKQVKVLKAMLDAAEACEPDYQKALGKLTLFSDLNVGEGEGLRLAVEEAEKESQDFAATAGGDEFQGELAKARSAVAEYSKLASISDARGVALAEAEIAAAIKLLDRDTPDVKKATADVKKVAAELTQKTTKLSSLRADLAKQVGKVSTTVTSVLDYAPVDKSMELEARRQTARALWDNQQFEIAKTAWDDLEEDADDALATYKPDYDKWQTYSKKIADSADVLKEALAIPVLQGPANYLQSLIERTINAELIPAHKYGDACKLVESEQAIKSLAELQAKLKNPADPKFDNAELNFRAQVAIRRDKLDTKLAAASDELKKLAEKGGDISQFAAAADKILKTWNDGVKQVSAKKKDSDLDPYLSAALTASDQLKADIAQILANPKDLAQSQDAKKKVAEAAEFEKARNAAETAMRELAEYNLPDSDPLMAKNPSIVDLRSGFKSLVDNAKKGVYSTSSIEKIGSDCRNKQEFIEHSLQEIRDAAVKKAADLKAQIDKAAKANKEYKTFFEDLRDEVDACLGRTRSSVISQVQQGAADLDKVQLPDAGDFAKVTSGLKEVDTLLGNADLKAYRPADQDLFTKRLAKELKPRVQQLSPAQALTEITEFQDEIKESTTRAGELKAILTAVQERAKAAGNQLEDLKATAPALYKSLSERLNRVKDPDKAAVDQANLELASIEILIKSAKSGKPALDKLEKKSKLDEFEQKRLKATFEGSLEVFTRGLKVEAQNLFEQIPKGQRNTDIFEQMEKVAQSAKKMGDKGNFAGANEELISAVNLAKYFLANPMDRSTASRKELTRLNQEYKGAVSAYLKELSDLVAELKAAEEPDGAGGTRKAATGPAIQAIQPLFSLFAAGQFDARIKQLAEAPVGLEALADQRLYKEAALSDIRLFEKALDANPMLAHVVANPIKPVSVKQLRDSLRALKAALLVCDAAK
jgi:hypothetical protein